MKQFIEVTEDRERGTTTLVPIENIEYIQSSLKPGGNVQVRLKSGAVKYMFVTETIAQIKEQLR
jgi:prefoldin subunit 5